MAVIRLFQNEWWLDQVKFMNSIAGKIEKLIEKVGTPYQMFFDDGTYLGCFFPIYELYPDLPKFNLPYVDPLNPQNFEYGISKISENADEIKEEELQIGDVICTKYREELHTALYIGKNKFIHVFRDHSLQINNLSFFRKDRIRFFRVKKWQ